MVLHLVRDCEPDLETRVVAIVNRRKGPANVGPCDWLAHRYGHLAASRIIKQDQVVVAFKAGNIIGVPTGHLELVTVGPVKTIQVRQIFRGAGKRWKPVINVVTVAVRTAAVTANQLQLMVKIEPVGLKAGPKARVSRVVNQWKRAGNVRTGEVGNFNSPNFLIIRGPVKQN